MELFIDIGNTNIKVHYIINHKEYYLNFPTKKKYTPDTFFNQLPNELKNAKVSKAYICSVVPIQSNVIEGMIKRIWNIKPMLIQHPIKTGIKINTDNPKNVGADLIAMASYASKHHQAAIIVNMGTATTIVYVKKTIFEGAIFIPGIEISYESLINNASKLNDVKLKVDKKMNLGKNTSEAISIGVLKGHANAIKGLVEKINNNCHVYLSGGNSKKIINLLDKYEYVKEITIQGMKIIKDLND